MEIPCRLQQIQPDVTSLIVAPVLARFAASRLVSPKSFSIIKIFICRFYVLFSMCCKNVVFPDPRNPDMITIGIIRTS